MKCDGYRILIQEMLRGRLDIDEAAVVVAHMDACASCRSFHRGLVNAERTPEGCGTSRSSVRQKPTGRKPSNFPVAAAAILAAILLGFAALAARHVGWQRADSPCRAAHHAYAQERSR